MDIENKGVIYYKLENGYEDDITKGCGLSGDQIDGNFYFLRGYDISSFDLSDGKLIIRRLNGETLNIDIKQCFNDYDFEYDSENGILKIAMPYGKTFDITGFLTKNDIQVFSDDSINGDGTKNNPLTISNTVKTGTYKPAKAVIDTSREKLPTNGVSKHDRYVTKEKISKFGLLYPLDGVHKIEERLRSIGSEWRVPTKEDWDNLLNSVETYPEDRNHSETQTGVFLGMEAGAALKTFSEWTPYYKELDDGEIVLAGKRYAKNDNGNYDIDENGNFIKIYMSKNKYAFSIYPVGCSFSGGADNIGGYGNITAFWTNTEADGLTFAKIFSYDEKGVGQDVYGDDSYLSLRLVKDYNGNNYNAVENIDGNLVVTKMFSVDAEARNSKALIWTSENVYFSNEEFKGVASNEWDNSATSEYRFYINEWDGQQWVRNTMEEGESIAIFEYNDKKLAEWRIIDGELKDATVTFEGAISEEFKAFDKRLNDANEALNAEVKERRQADIEIANNINVIKSDILAINENIGAIDAAVGNNAELISAHISANIHITDEERNRWDSASEDIEFFLNENADINETIDTLKEIQNWINEEGIEVAKLAEIDSKLTEEIRVRKESDDAIIQTVNVLNDTLQVSIDDIENVLEITTEHNNSIQILQNTITEQDEKIVENKRLIEALQSTNKTQQETIDAQQETINAQQETILSIQEQISTILSKMNEFNDRITVFEEKNIVETHMFKSTYGDISIMYDANDNKLDFNFGDDAIFIAGDKIKDNTNIGQ